MRCGYIRLRGIPGVGSYRNNELQFVKIGWWIEYACGVRPETIKIDRRVDLKCTWSSSLREEINSCIHRVSAEYVGRGLQNNTLTWHRWGSLAIPGSFQLHCTEGVSGESRSWQPFSGAMDSKLFNSVDLENITNSIVAPVSGTPEVDKVQIIGIKLMVERYLKKPISITDIGITIPHGPNRMNMGFDCSFDRFLQ